MNKILDFSEFFVYLNNGVTNFTPIILLTLVIVVGTVVALFLYTFQRQESPKFRQSPSGNNSNGKRKKRPVSSNAPSATTQVTQPLVEPHREKTISKKVETSSNLSASVDNKKQKPNKPAPKISKATAKNTIKPKKAVPPKTIANSNDDEGEWKTVTTKKQRKQPTAPIPDLLIQAVAEVAAVASKKSNATKNTINSRASNTNNKSNVNNDEEKQAGAISQQKENIVLRPVVAAPVANSPPDSLIADVAIAAKNGASAAGSGLTNVVFDELGDNSWTENKPQRKNKKRAVRE